MSAFVRQNTRFIDSESPRQNGHHCAYDTFKRIFLNENAWIVIEISLWFVPKGLINNMSALVQVVAWRRTCAKPLSNQLWLDYRRIYASFGLNELKEVRWQLPFHCYSMCRNSCITGLRICSKEDMFIVRSAIWKCLHNIQMGISSVWWRNVSKKIEAKWIHHQMIYLHVKLFLEHHTTDLAPDHTI